RSARSRSPGRSEPAASAGPAGLTAPGLIWPSNSRSASGEDVIATLGRCPHGAPACQAERHRAWLVNAATPEFPGHTNNAARALVVPRLPTGRFRRLPLTALAAAG